MPQALASDNHEHVWVVDRRDTDSEACTVTEDGIRKNGLRTRSRLIYYCKTDPLHKKDGAWTAWSACDTSWSI
jgi:hypothetical protein